MKKIVIFLFLFVLARQAFPGESSIQFQYSSLTGIGQEEGVMRRDPSDIIRVGGLFYVWYTKGAQDSGYDATIYYAVSPDGKAWTEKGEALARGPKGSRDEQSVFTPNILAARGRHWLYYTSVPKPFFNQGNRDKENGTLTTSPKQYEKNLQQLVCRLKETGARPIWASTTPVPGGELGRFKDDEVRYNAIAQKIMQENGIAVDDLYSNAALMLAEYQLPNGNVHDTEEGYKYLAEEAAQSIQSALQTREKIDPVRFLIIEQTQLRTAGLRNSRPPEADLLPLTGINIGLFSREMMA